MAWSSYAHLPNGEKEYVEILSQIENGMSTQEVDSVIATVKKKEKVQHHYRSNLVNLGLFDIIGGKVHLNYDARKLKKDSRYLRTILADCLEKNGNDEIKAIRAIICKEKTYELRIIVECLEKEFPDIDKSNFTRWTRPIVSAFKIIGLLSEQSDKELIKIEKVMQNAYFNLTDDYGNIVALEALDKELKKINGSYNIVLIVEEICNSDLKFKIELLMLPNWATHNKAYTINNEYYTHVKVKHSLLEESVS